MYANKDNPPPPKEVLTSGIDSLDQLDHLMRLGRVMEMIIKARMRARYCCVQYHTYSPHKSPFVTRSRWRQDMDKWLYIRGRLEKYYYTKICKLASSVCEQLICG